MFRKEVQRQSMYTLCPRVHLARWAGVEHECARHRPVDIFYSGDLADLVVGRPAGRFRVEYNHPPITRVVRKFR